MAKGGNVNLGYGGKVNLGGGSKVNLGFGKQPKIGGGKTGKIGIAGGPATPAMRKGGGGFFSDVGHLGHWIGEKASLAGHDIEGIPGGTYHLVKPLGVQFYDIARYGPRDAWGGKKGERAFEANQRDALRQTRGVVENAKQSIEHPLRDPFQTALTVGPALHGLGRIGEVARGVDTSAPRMLRAGEGERFNLSPPSRGAHGRAGQAVYDKALQRGLDKNVEGRVAGHAMKRIGGQVQEAERARQGMRASQADHLEKLGRKLNRHEQAALRLTSENVTPGEAAAYHEHMATKGGEAASRHVNLANTYRAIQKQGWLKLDENKNVAVDAMKNPRLAKADEVLAKVQARNEQIVHEHGLMNEQGARERLDAPGIQIRGAISEAARERSTYGPKGRGFVTEKPFEARAPKTGAARAGSGVIGETRSPIASKARTGLAREQGHIPDNTTRLVAQNARGLNRYVNTHELRKEWLRAATDTKQSSHDTLIREPGTPKGQIPTEYKAQMGQGKMTYDELVNHESPKGPRGFLEDILPHLKSQFHDDKNYGIGAKAPKGFKWVDRRIVGDYANAFSGSRGKFGRGMDTVNSGITAGTVYFKPGHAGTRVLTNAATNIMQGSAGLRQIAKTRGLFKALSEEDRMRALRAAGQHGFEAMPHEGVGVIGHIATRGAQGWAKYADARFRFNSIAYEARKAGYKTPAQFRDFLNKLENPEGLSAEEKARVENVAKRANREAIAYDRLNDKEKRVIARAIWFYPWMKGSLAFTGNAIREHPFKAAAGANLGAQERKRQGKALGEMPSYEFGLVPIGKKDAQGNVPVTNFQTFSPFSTLGNVLQLPEYASAVENLNPAAGALFELGSRTNQYGQHSNSPITDALQSLFSATPEFQIGAAAAGKKSKMFPTNNSWEGQLLRALIGPAYPRKVNLADLNKAAGLEKSGR